MSHGIVGARKVCHETTGTTIQAFHAKAAFARALGSPRRAPQGRGKCTRGRRRLAVGSLAFSQSRRGNWSAILLREATRRPRTHGASPGERAGCGPNAARALGNEGEHPERRYRRDDGRACCVAQRALLHFQVAVSLCPWPQLGEVGDSISGPLGSRDPPRDSPTPPLARASCHRKSPSRRRCPRTSNRLGA